MHIMVLSYCSPSLSMMKSMEGEARLGTADDGDITILTIFRKTTSSFSTMRSSMIGIVMQARVVLAAHLS